MKTIKITKFFETDYIDAAQYISLRNIASFCDGLKNSSRKTVFAITKKHIRKDVKVSRLKSTVAEMTEYLHGEDNLSSVIVNMAKRYVGTNNLPLLKDSGNFGKRLINDASADRYISTHGEIYLEKIFNEDDFFSLQHQVFEKVDIEPRYYVPTLPMLLINGSKYGIAVGFKQDILARPLGEMLKATKNYIKTGEFIAPKPGWNGFKGEVRKVDGTFVSLFHNETLCENDQWKGWSDIYLKMVVQE